MEKVSTLLRQAREGKKISLKEVETATRVPLRYLQLLEAGGETHLLSDKLYLVPYLRTYAAFLDLNSTTVVNQFVAEIQGAHLTESVETQNQRSLRRGTSWVVSLGFFLVLLWVLSVIPQNGELTSRLPLWMKGREPSSPSPPPEPPSSREASPESTPLPLVSPSVPKVVPKSAPLPRAVPTSPPGTRTADVPSPPPLPRPTTPSASQSKPLPAAASHQLKMRAKEETWIRVIIDGQQQKDVLLQPGQEVEWSAQQEFILTLGNAGGVEITLDGKDLPPLGKSGQVIRNLQLPSSPSNASLPQTRSGLNE